jgi:hypothetical protein
MESRQTTFTNLSRWTIEPDSHSISLEHLLRHDHPVFLLDLFAVEESVLESSEPHLGFVEIGIALTAFSSRPTLPALRHPFAFSTPAASG